MPFASHHEPIAVPETDVFGYLFGRGPVSDRPLWIDSRRPGVGVSPRQALRWARRLGLGLERLGLRTGDVVLVCSPNHVLVPAAFLGIAAAGLVFTGVNPAATVRELAQQLSDSGAKAVLAHPSVIEAVLEAAARVGLPADRIFLFSDDATRGGDRQGGNVRQGEKVRDWTAMVAAREEADGWQRPVLQPREAIVTLNYSSGTTGLAKGVCGSHHNLVANVEQIMAAMGDITAHARARDERWICFLPLYHAYGQLFTIVLAAKLDVPVYVMAGFDLAHYLGLIERHRITTLHLVPPVLVMLSKRPDASRHDLSSLRNVLCGGAPLSAEIERGCQQRLNVQIRQAWGMTELTCGCSMPPAGLHDNAGSVGHLFPNCEAKLLDDQGREVGPGQPGELYVRGPNVFLGYWRNERATREAIDDQGWLRTGDIATRNKDGLMWIVDRKKELIKVNALQVAPAELEALLLENEHVADAAVVGFPLDADKERPRAYVVIQDASRDKVTPEHIRSWVASRVARYKRLDGGVVFVDEIPKLASGKIKRKVMRDRAQMDASRLRARGGKDGDSLKASL